MYALSVFHYLSRLYRRAVLPLPSPSLYLYLACKGMYPLTLTALTN